MFAREGDFEIEVLDLSRLASEYGRTIIPVRPASRPGMTFTLALTAFATVGGIIFGTLLAMMRLSGFVPISVLAVGYVNLMRSVPLLLVIFWFYFLVPEHGRNRGRAGRADPTLSGASDAIAAANCAGEVPIGTMSSSSKALAHIGQRQDAHRLAMEPGNDRLRRAGRCQQREDRQLARGRPKLNEVDASSFGPKIMIRFLPAAVVAISFCPIPTPPSPSIAGH
jgi:His/Glu/Gln/Arg/opine family amino acid ABC transporter permease subunit